jgi:glycosyltransferase involved in cell wall biosynthesis
VARRPAASRVGEEPDNMTSGKLAASQQPLVSVLTPVYNGESHLVECIESVLAQTYQNWEYIIVNNCSTDRTADIIDGYARREPRIRVMNNREFVSANKNHNIALTLISPQSKYCKFVQADDFLFPSCLKEMVAVAEANPSAGIVTAYHIQDRWVWNDGWPYPSTLVPGHDVCRLYFLERQVRFGTMSSFLLRSDLVRSRNPAFFNEKYLFCDTEIYFVILQNYDYAFVHQVLSFHRVPQNALSSFAERNNQSSFSVVYLTKTYGRIYLTSEEYERCWRHALNRYYRRQGHELFHFRERGFWQYHHKMMEGIGLTFSVPRLLRGAMAEAADVVFEPINAVGRMIRFIRSGRAYLRHNEDPKAFRRTRML